MDTQTDEQRLAEFEQNLNNFRPEGFDEEQFNKLKESVVNFHKNEVQGLKINSAKMKEEKDKLSDKITGLESQLNNFTAENKTLSEKLAANQPDELKKLYENQQKALQDGFTKMKSDLEATIKQQAEQIKTLESGVLERDVMAKFNEVAATKNWLGGGREAAQTILLGQNGSNFSRLKMPDGSTVLINKDQQDMGQALDKFLATELGKSFLKSGLSGGGADGSTTNNSGSGKKYTEAQFNALSPEQQMNAVMNGEY